MDRINCSMDENSNPDIPASSIFSINLGKRKSKRYQQASVREIEYDLYRIINDLQDSILLNNRFIIVLDELDKLDSPKIESDKTKTINEAPTFSFEEISSNSDMNQYERQHGILMFLGRLKYFTTNAKAKFVFIAGHELYDAYLADVSDREYAISSMFNGVLNLNSFLSSRPEYKNVTKMAESFLCKALVNLEYMKMKNSIDGKVKELKKELRKINKKLQKTTGDLIGKNIDYKNLLEDKAKISKKIEKLSSADKDSRDDSIYTLKNVEEEFRTTYHDHFHHSREQWESVFHFLQQFVTYLAFTSNGAPKKLANQLEKYIISEKQCQKISEYRNQVGNYIFFLGENGIEAKYYLSFRYPDKEKIGFIHHMAQPIFNNIINHNSDYDDKLLVTSMFLVSHLYKHHGNGFSWRNLEYIPELIESNKTPELRGYIKDILNLMEKMDLTSTTSGIYAYKFSKSLIEEISHFSRKFEEVSAIFNFSLDYFRAVKSYFNKLLLFYNKNQNDKNASKEVIANIYNYLGDIQMAGEEYTEAASNFRMAADLFRKAIKETQKSDKNYDTSLLIMRYTYAMLKLGLAYEKRSTFDSAYLVYNSLTNTLIDYRYIPDNKLFDLKSGIVFDRKNLEKDINNVIMYVPDANVQTRPSETEKFLPDYISEEQTREYRIWVYGSEMFSNLYHYLTPSKEQILSKLTAFEDLRISYLTILAKLFALEKQSVSGITRENVELCVSEFECMYMLTKLSAKHVLAADFYRKLGDILYYKNKSYCENNSWNDVLLLCASGFNVKHILLDFMFYHRFKKENIDSLMKWFCDSVSERTADTFTDNPCQYFTYNLRNELVTYINDEGINREDIDNLSELLQRKLDTNNINPDCLKHSLSEHKLGRPCVACMFYNKSLLAIMEKIPGYSSKNSHSKAIDLIKASFKNTPINTVNELKHTALVLEAMGNTMLSCADKESTIDLNFISKVLRANRADDIDNPNVNFLERAILYNIAASRFFEKAGEYTSMTECLHKTMQVLYNHFKILLDREKLIQDGKVLVDTLDKVLRHTFEIVYKSKAYHIIDIQKSRQTIHSLDNQEDSFIMLGLSPIMSDLENLIYDYFRIKLLISKSHNKLLSYLKSLHERLYTRNKQLEIELKILTIEYKLKEPSILIDTIDSLYNAPSLRCFRNESLAGNRVNAHIFKSFVNNLTYEKAFGNSCDNTEFRSHLIDLLKLNKKDDTDIDSEHKLKVFLIADSIFCLTTAISILTTIRTNTLYPNVYYAEIYESLLRWVKRREELTKCGDEKTDKYLDKQLHLLINDSSARSLNETYCRKMKESHLDQAWQIHSEGSAYHNMIDRFYIIDDDLQNNTSQFMLALERYLLRTEFEKRVDEDHPDNKAHSYYKIDEYLANYNSI